MTTRTAKPAAGERIPEFALSLVLTTRAARDVLALAAHGDGAEPKVDDGGPSESAARDLGTEALARLLDPRAPYNVYLRNAGSSGDGEQVVELRVASDGVAPANAALIEQLGGRSLLLVGAEKHDRHSSDIQFLLFSVRAIPEVWCQKDAWSQPARVRFGGAESGFPPRLLAAIAKMPEPKAQRETVQRRMGDWRRYLGILERTAKARQFSVTYKAFRRGPAANQLIFTLDPGREPIAWDKLRSSVDEPLEVRERRGLASGNRAAGNGAAQDDDDTDDWLLGYIVDTAPEKNELRLALDDEAEKLLEHRTLALPRTAALIYKAAGDLAQVRRLKFGLELLEQGYGENPRLSEFLFDAGQARKPDPARRVALDRAELLQPRLNEGQRSAVEGALNAPDLFLIQGPPGTGKTTVIAEICYQNALRGQRTLIASQSNLAVDHALSRLIHHPRIRALRRGRAERVEVEGAPFLEDQVVGTWLAKTAESCEHDLAARRDSIRRFEELLSNRGRLETLSAALRGHAEARPRHAAAITGLEVQIPALKHQSEQLARSLERRRAAQAGLQRLKAALTPGEAAHPDAEDDPSPSATAEFQPDDLALLDRMRLGEHPALQRLRDAGLELNGALDTWDTETPEPRDPEATPLGFAVTLHEAATVRQRTKITAARLADLHARLDQLHHTGVDWLASRDQAEALEEERASLAATEASLRSRRTALEAEQQSLQTKLQELANFDGAQASVGSALRGWVERLTGGGAATEPVGPVGLGTPPPEFGSPLRREIWAAASQAAQLHKLSALALEVRTGRAEVERFTELSLRVSSAAEPLLAALDRRPTPLATRAREARRAASWRQSALRGLVATDAHGDLHPAFSGATAWAGIERQLAELRVRPGRVQALMGAEQRRQQTLALWAQQLGAAAEDFSKRREELEGLTKHRAARLHERTEATALSLETEVARAAQLFGPQAQQRLAEVAGILAEVVRAQPAVTARLDELDQQLAALAEGQQQRAAELQTGLHALGDTRRTRPFQHLLRQVGPEAARVAVDEWSRAWQAATGTLDEALERLRVQAAAVDPLGALDSVAADLELDAARVEHQSEKARQTRRVVEQDLQGARERLRVLEEQLGVETGWWRAVHAALPERLRAAGPAGAAPDSIEYVEAMLIASAGWKVDLEQEQAYLARAQNLVTDWVKRLRAAGPRDSADLKQIYIDNANVIGITCVQAGAHQFSRAYRNFDCVVVDEVSKATPPELLLPMLKGARVVLVGDHQQLPPMIGPESLADLAGEMEVPTSDLEHLERSLFKELFEMAPPELRVMLTEQYRMHPQIMDAINQFYAGKLTSAIADPDTLRAHGFELPWLHPENHLVWINTPTEGPFVEQRLGTTYMNAGEVDVILRLIQTLDAAWASQVAAGRPPKEVGVITFYGAQVRELKSRLIERAGRYKNLRLRVGTVDRFQGMERPIIIASLVRNNDQGSVGFARKPERVNVAFSRAQELLIIVGSRELFCERARNTGRGDEPAATAIYGKVAEVVQRAGGQRKTSDVSGDYKR